MLTGVPGIRSDNFSSPLTEMATSSSLIHIISIASKALETYIKLTYQIEFAKGTLLLMEGHLNFDVECKAANA